MSIFISTTLRTKLPGKGFGDVSFSCGIKVGVDIGSHFYIEVTKPFLDTARKNSIADSLQEKFGGATGRQVVDDEKETA